MKKSSSTSVFRDSLRKESGFTLLEILIAIVILAFITFAVVSITENAINTKERTTETNTNNLQIETAMSRFEWDFSQIYSPLYFTTLMNFNQNALNQDPNNPNGQQAGTQPPPAQGGAQAPIAPNPFLQQYQEQLMARLERNEHFSGVSKDGQPVPRFYAPEKNVFEFFTTSNRRKLENQKQSHFAWVRYSLSEQQQTKEEEENTNIPKSLKSLVRYYTADDPYSEKRIDIEDIERVKGAVLLRNVENLEFQYWDFQRRKWETSLRSIAQGENVIRGVKVLVTWYDSNGAKRTTTRIFRNHWPLVAPQDQGNQVPAGFSPIGGNPGANDAN